MLYDKYPSHYDKLTLTDAWKDLEGDIQAEIPFLVWLLENPASPLNLPGSISLLEHDYIHLLLKKGFTPADEAYILGFTMGNNTRANCLHLLTIKIATYLLYPRKYKFNYQQLKVFDRGVKHGRVNEIKNINELDWTEWNSKILKDIRLEFKLKLEADMINKASNTSTNESES